jgi:hypothetical protein
VPRTRNGAVIVVVRIMGMRILMMRILMMRILMMRILMMSLPCFSPAAEALRPSTMDLPGPRPWAGTPGMRSA